MLFLVSIFVFIFLSIPFGLIAYVIYCRRYYDILNDIPGPPITSFIFGNVLYMNERWKEQQRLDHTAPSPILQMTLDWHKQYGSIYRIWGVHAGSIVLGSSEVIKDVLRKDTPKGFIYSFLHSWLGIGLLTSNGDVWKRKRRLLTPAFHFQILQGYISVFYNCSKILVDKWKLVANTGQEFDIFPQFTALTLDIIGLCAFNCDLNAQKNSNSEYVQAVYSFRICAFSSIYTITYL